MAEKVEQKQFEKKSKLVEIFTKDYKYEGLILLILVLIAITLGVLITSKVMTIPQDVFLIGEYPIVFAVILIVLGALSLILSIMPYYRPSIYELKRVTWPTKKTLLENCIYAFSFTIIVSLFFWGCDALLSLIVDWIN